MEIKTLKLGMLNTNCYILDNNFETLIIDPADDAGTIIKNLKHKPIGILITHYHFDHVGALNELIEKYPEIKIYDHQTLEEGENNIGKFKFVMIRTPGHKSDLISFLFGNNLFSGDFIFESSIGRCDLPTGNFNIMKESIKKILTYDENIIIYPGHGNKTTLFKEKKNLLTYLD